MQEKPQQLFDLIQKYIMETEKPQEIQFKPIEQSYQTNKKMKQFNISEDEMDRMLHLARQAQDDDLLCDGNHALIAIFGLLHGGIAELKVNVFPSQFYDFAITHPCE